MLARFGATIALCWLPALAGAYDIVSGENRIALVIGNASYRTAPLRNPVNDAQAVAAALKVLGFQVIMRENATQREMLDALREFAQRASKNQVRLLFYAGHGVQIKGRNYLMPVDAEVQTEEEIAQKGADVTELLERLGTLSSGVNLIVLDACRNNPFTTAPSQLADSRRFRTRGLTSQSAGLAPLHAPSGTLIAFSTAPGSVAIDNPQQRNSVYTKHLLENLRTPGMPIERMFKQVRVAVAQETQQQQVPWETSSLMGEFCFRTDTTGKCSG
ncbi:MAG: caspase family protein [Betaproteobacteria bacterium]